MRYQVIGRQNVPGYPEFWDGSLWKTKAEARDRVSVLSQTGVVVALEIQPVTAGTVISAFGQRYKGDP